MKTSPKDPAAWRMFVLVTLFLATAPMTAVGADPLPAARRTDWTYAGVPGGIPNRTTICATFNSNATASQINSAIGACTNGVVFLNAGTYSSLGGNINLNRSNVTVRGAGANLTILTGNSTIVRMQAGGNVGINRTITAGGAKGTSSITVSATTDLAVGTVIEVDRDNDPAFVTTLDPARALTQVNIITAINGLVLTVRNPWFHNFSTGTPRIKNYFVGVIKNSGFEDLKIEHGGSSGAAQIEYTDSCWLKGVESANSGSYHFILLGNLNFEVRDSYIHHGASGPNNSGLNFYGSYTYGTNSNAKIENTIFNKDFPAIELNGSSSGFYIGYNYSYGSPSIGGYLVTWAFDDGHAPHNSFNLYEGNIGEMWGADNYFGGTSFATALRNYFTGVNLNGPAIGDAVWLDRLAYNYNILGNVLGSATQSPAVYSGCNNPAIYRLGYPNLGNCSTTPYDNYYPPGNYPDPKVISTVLRWGNYDYFSDVTRWESSEVPSGVSVPGDHVIPNSYYYATRPAWWPAGVAWPPIGPDVTGGNGDAAGHVNKIPAQLCWESRNLVGAGTFNAAACYPASGGPPSAPTNVQVF